MTGAPREAYAPRDFIVLSLAAVDQVGLEPALLFQRIAWRCERTGSWVATIPELMAETRLTKHKVHRALDVLRAEGWVEGVRGDRFRPTLTWTVTWEDGSVEQRPEVLAEAVGAGQPVNQESRFTSTGESASPVSQEIGFSTVLQDVGEQLHTADAVAAPTAEGLFAVPDPEPEEPAGPPKTAQTLVARWCDGYRDANGGADAPKAFMGRVAGQARALAKACGLDHEEWVLAWNASYSAGQAGHADMTRHLVRTSRVATGRRNVFADPALGGPTADTMARFTAHLTGPTRPELETPR